jgi:hypothetical protein
MVFENIKYKINEMNLNKLGLNLIVPIFIIWVATLLLESELPTWANSKIFFVLFIASVVFYFVQKIREIPEVVRDKSSLIYYFSHLFLLSLAVIAINQFLKRAFIANNLFYISVLSIGLGFLTFYANRERVEKEIKDEKNSEDFNEEIRKKDFQFKFPRINKIPVIRNIIKWMYKEGWWYSVGLIFVVLLISLFLFFNLGQIKFIDTDEGRLLYDAQLISEGKMPFKDFNARAPVVIYGLSKLIPFLGHSIEPYYIFSIVLNLISVILIYFLLRIFFDKKYCLLATFLFGIAPIRIISSWLKTQTFQLPLIILAFIFFFYHFEKEKGKIYLLFSYLLFLLAFFCRESTIFFFFPIAIYLLSKKRFKTRGGMLSIFLMVSTIVIFLVFTNIFFTYGTAGVTNSISAMNFSIEENTFIRAVMIPLYVTLFGLISILFSFLIKFFTKEEKLRSGISFIFWGFIGLCIGYFLNSLRLSFFPQYLMEISLFYIPLLALTVYLLPKIFRNWEKVILILAIIFLIFSSSISSYDGIREYKGIFHLEGTNQVSAYIEENTNDSDVIFGGIPMYSFISGREHFMGLSHEYYGESMKEIVINNIIDNPPRFIIMDKYLSNMYLPISSFEDILSENYTAVKTFEEKDYRKKWAVVLYEIN